MSDILRRIPENYPVKRPLTPAEQLSKKLADDLAQQATEARGRATALKTIDPSETRDFITKEEFRAVIKSVVLKAPPK